MSNILKGIINEGAYQDGVNDGKRGQANPRASSIYGPESGEYQRGYNAGLKQGDVEKQERVNQYKQEIAQYDDVSTDELKQMLRDVQKRMHERQAIYDKLRGSSLSFDAKKHLPPNHAEMAQQHKKDHQAWNTIHQVLFQRGIPQDQRLAEEQLDELSPETLASYKKKAGADASAADKAGDYDRGNKRFSGIIRATKKEFDNDAKGIKENAEELNMGDPVVVTGDVQFNGATGDIVGFSNDKHFVIVDLYNHGKRSFHSSDVSFNDYADSDDEHEHINRVAEDEEPAKDTDAILEYLTKAIRTMQEHKDSFSPEGWDRIKRGYNYMRSYLMDGDYEGFLSAYNEALRSYPDSTGLLIDEMFTAAGLDENATIEDFFAKVSEIKEGKVKDALIKGTYGKSANEPKTRSSGMFSGIVNARNAIEKSKNSQKPNYNKVCDMCKRAGDSCVCEDMPPPENARKTQIAGTLPTYKKAADILNKTGVKGKALDFGAGLGMGTAELGKDAHSYEPFPNEKFKPHFVDVTKIPDNSYHKIVNLNVLNVVPNTGEHKIRDAIVKNIGRVLAPGGVALITTRGKDVLTIKGTPGEEPTSMISKIGTYQKGFTQKELLQYIQQTLGKGFEVSSIKLGPAGVMIKKLDQEGVAEGSRYNPYGKIKFLNKKTGEAQSFYYWQSVEGPDMASSMVTNNQLVPAHDDGTEMSHEEFKQALYNKNKGVVEAEGEAKPVNMKRWLRDFERREDNNFHTENVLAMAQLVGTPEDVATMKKLVKLHRGFGLGEKEFEIRHAIADRLRPLVKQKIADSQAQPVAEGFDSEDLANEVYAEFERIYPNLARRANERTVHAAIMDVLNYGGDNNPSALAQDVARAVKRDIEQGVAEGLPGGLSSSDYMPGQTLRHVNRNCLTCSGHKFMYKLGDKLFTDNKQGATQITCPACNGTGMKKGVEETTNSPKFQSMISKITSPKALDTREALAMMMDLVYHQGASYKEALQQASMSYEMDPAELNALYKKQEQGLAEAGSPAQQAAIAVSMKKHNQKPHTESLEETYHGNEFDEAYGDLWYDEDQLNEAEYQGRKVQLGKPMRGDVKKFKVYVKDPSTGNIKKVNFGDPNMRIKKSIPGRRKSFRARHHCETPGPRTKARYWSCRKW